MGTNAGLTDMRDVFLSHRGVDKTLVRDIAAAIESAEFEGRRLTAWVDEAEIRPGQSVPGMINYGLEHSRFIALVMTPAYFDQNSSGWTHAEWHAALYTDPDNRRARIIPLLAADCAYIPILLRHLLSIDLRGSKFDDGVNQFIEILRDEPVPRPVVYRGQLIKPNGLIERASLIAERSIPDGDPDPVTESLSCNLLPVERLPIYVYEAPLRESLTIKVGSRERLPNKEEVKQMIREAQTKAGCGNITTPAFRLVSGRILTFHDLDAEDSLFSPVIDDAEVLPTSSWWRFWETKTTAASSLP